MIRSWYAWVAIALFISGNSLAMNPCGLANGLDHLASLLHCRSSVQNKEAVETSGYQPPQLDLGSEFYAPTHHSLAQSPQPAVNFQANSSSSSSAAERLFAVQGHLFNSDFRRSAARTEISHLRRSNWNLEHQNRILFDQWNRLQHAYTHSCHQLMGLQRLLSAQKGKHGNEADLLLLQINELEERIRLMGVEFPMEAVSARIRISDDYSKKTEGLLRLANAQYQALSGMYDRLQVTTSQAFASLEGAAQREQEEYRLRVAERVQFASLQQHLRERIRHLEYQIGRLSHQAERVAHGWAEDARLGHQITSLYQRSQEELSDTGKQIREWKKKASDLKNQRDALALIIAAYIAYRTGKWAYNKGCSIYAQLFPKENHSQNDAMCVSLKDLDKILASYELVSLSARN